MSLINKNTEKVIVVEDSKFFKEMWKQSLKVQEVLIFTNPEILIDEFLLRNDLFDNVTCIILDYFYDGFKKNVVEMNIITELREFGYKNPCFLSSAVPCNLAEFKLFDGFIEKLPYSLEEIKCLFPDKF
ncbi:hypothetical protein [Fluviispira multicolorata]|uniref:Response regulatory domain-containing protein n=1 Tax=Fluviispira multicolorata TaxID=2654512 RepID=A0A833N4U1_9BACT|nr:hypothetical protein [Fluviispira multicolorata]KAB8029033.1 hypothetical protein GCL57_10855 [Fluviispira multicolorata]